MHTFGYNSISDFKRQIVYTLYVYNIQTIKTFYSFIYIPPILKFDNRSFLNKI